eukprot:1883965-Pyramimonas_sp.AAC.1
MVSIPGGTGWSPTPRHGLQRCCVARAVAGSRRRGSLRLQGPAHASLAVMAARTRSAIISAV